MSETWQQKHERATALVQQVKKDKEGIQKAEDAEKLTAKMTDARRLMAEVQAERKDEENHRLTALLEEFERQQDNSSAQQAASPRDGAVVAPVQTQQAKVDETMRAAFSTKSRLVVDNARSAERVAEALPILKAALSEGTPGSGGFLVPPLYMQDLFAATRRQGNALRALGWLSVHPVDSSNQVMIPRGSGAATVGIVAENATKPSADQTFTQIQISIFTWAGISKQSKQMAADATPMVLDLSTRELGSLIGNLEEQKIINGSGTGEPRGILNVIGLSSPSPLAAGLTQQAVVDKMLDAVVGITTNYFGPPSGALMHPRRLAWLLKAKDTQNNYIFNPGGQTRSPNFTDAADGVTSVATGQRDPAYNLFGLPIGISANVPTTLGAGTNEDVIVVGAWQEAHWFQRQDVTVDVTDTAGTSFEQNQVWIRMEERAGFSAERYPTAFAVVTGPSLSQV